MEFDGDIYVNHIAYNAKGQRLLVAYGNTQMTRYVYDNLTFRLARLKTEKYAQASWTFTPQSGNTRQDYAYIYDLVGNIVTTSDRTPDCGVGGTNSLDRNFIYDPLYRLLQGTGRENVPASTFPWWDDSYRSEDHSTTTVYTQSYEYDKVGNIQELQHVAGINSFTREFDYSSTNNQLAGITVGGDTYSYLYDAVGNQILENTTRHFEYNYANNMRCFYNQAGTSEPTIYALYLYSGGERVKKLVRTSGGGYESTSYIGGGYEYKTNGTDEQNTLSILDDSSRIAMIRIGDDMGDSTPNIKYNLEDVQGTSMTLLDDAGSFVNREEYYPFGETSFGSYALKRYRFQGKEKDSESGLYYYGARYYCASSCRFISVDAVLQPEESPYVGLANNPVNKIDPDGNMALDGTNSSGSSAEIIAKTQKVGKTTLSPAEREFVEQTLDKAIKQGIKHESKKLFWKSLGRIVGGAILGATRLTNAVGLFLTAWMHSGTIGGGLLPSVYEFYRPKVHTPPQNLMQPKEQLEMPYSLSLAEKQYNLPKPVSTYRTDEPPGNDTKKKPLKFLYLTYRNFKNSAALKASGQLGPAKSLPYFGVTKNPIAPGRYGRTDVQGVNPKIIAVGPEDEINGAESVLIYHNSPGGDVINSPYIDNLTVTYPNPQQVERGKAFLDMMVPGWQEKYNFVK